LAYARPCKAEIIGDARMRIAISLRLSAGVSSWARILPACPNSSLGEARRFRAWKSRSFFEDTAGWGGSLSGVGARVMSFAGLRGGEGSRGGFQDLQERSHFRAERVQRWGCRLGSGVGLGLVGDRLGRRRGLLAAAWSLTGSSRLRGLSSGIDAALEFGRAAADQGGAGSRRDSGAGEIHRLASTCRFRNWRSAARLQASRTIQAREDVLLGGAHAGWNRS